VTETVHFTVDVHLLGELGERLVGKPAIALGELVKNAYDADATRVEISMGADNITVVDNGHGMTRKGLEEGFLRVGTGRKEAERFSPVLQRRMTGSKGVGRLATQMLGRLLTVETRSADGSTWLLRINWDDRTDGDDLTEFTAELDRLAAPVSIATQTGTAIRVTRLTKDWSPADVEDLARDVWMLRSPIPGDRTAGDSAVAFDIEFDAEEQELEQAFRSVLLGWIHLWQAKLTGHLHGPHKPGGGHHGSIAGQPHIHLRLELADGDQTRKEVLPALNGALGAADFEILIFKLQGRQPQGLTVGDVREYLNRLGGVYLFDEGFRLPYYGPDTDWLNIEMDHSHRRARSKTLPSELQVPGGLTFLPTTSRLFGAVHVSTNGERDRVRAGVVSASDSLQLQVSRDRLLDSAALESLKHAVRSGIDLYAHEMARIALRRAEETARRTKTEGEHVDPIELLEQFAGEMPEEASRLLRAAVETERAVSAAEVEVQSSRASALAALATAGMVSLLVEHEIAKLIPSLREFVERFETSEVDALKQLAHEVDLAIDQLAGVAPLLSPLTGPENRERTRLRARPVIHRSIESIESLMAGIKTEVDVDTSLRLPVASLAEWVALFQNLLLNAANAVIISSGSARIKVRGRGTRAIHVLDTGVGADLEAAPSYFEPFVRGGHPVPPERRARGLGGSGLGLTIVRTIAEAAGATVTFEKPPRGWSTDVALRW